MSLNVFERFVEKHIDGIGGKPWNMRYLSENTSITLNFVKKHPEMKWTKYLIYNTSVNPKKFTEVLFEKFQSFYNKIFQKNTSIIPENKFDVLKRVEKYPQDAELYSGDPEIIPEFIENHLELKWDMYYLSSNPNITPEFIEKHLEWDWNMDNLSLNPSIAPEFIEKYPYGIRGWFWDMDNLSGNNFTKSIQKEEAKLNFLLGQEYKRGVLNNFRKDFLFDPNLNRLILSYL